MSLDSGPCTPRMSSRQPEIAKDHSGVRDMLVTGRSLVRLDEAGQPVRQEEFNHHKMQGAAQVRFLSESLEELKKEVEILRGQGEHMKLRVTRTIEDHSKRLEVLETGSPQRIAPRPVEVQSSKVVDSPPRNSSGKSPMAALEARVDLLEGISRATTLMCTEVREEAAEKEQSLRSVLEQEVLMRATAADADEATRRALERSIQKLEDSAKLAQTELSQRLLSLEAKPALEDSAKQAQINKRLEALEAKPEQEDSAKQAQMQFNKRLEALEAKPEHEDFGGRITSLEAKVGAAVSLEDFGGRINSLEAKVGAAVSLQDFSDGIRKLEAKVAPVASLEDFAGRLNTLEAKVGPSVEAVDEHVRQGLQGIKKDLESRSASLERHVQQVEESLGHKADKGLEGRLNKLEQEHEAEQALEGRVQQLEQEHKAEQALEGRVKQLELEHKAEHALEGRVQQLEQKHNAEHALEGRVQQLERQHETEQALEGRVRQLEQAIPAKSATADVEQIEALAAKLKGQEDAQQVFARQLEKDQQRCDEACKTAGKVQAQQVQLSLSLQEERRLRTEGERAMEERLSKVCDSGPKEAEPNLEAVKAVQQQCSADLEKEAAARAEAVQALRQELSKELAERAEAVEALRKECNDEAGTGSAGSSNSAKFMKEERERLERALSQQARRLCEDNAARLEELFKKEAATRVDKLFKLSQRIETIEKEMPKAEKIREAQSQLERAMDAEAKNQEKVHLHLTEQLEQVLRTITEQQRQASEEQQQQGGEEQSPHAEPALADSASEQPPSHEELVAQMRARTLAASSGARNDGALACALGTGACMLLGLCMRAKGNTLS